MAGRRLADRRSDPPDPLRPRVGAAKGNQPEAGAAAVSSGPTKRVPPAVQAALDRMQSQFYADVRAICDSTCGQMEQLVASSLSDLSGKVDNHEKKLHDHSFRIKNLEMQMAVLQTQQAAATQHATVVEESVTEVRHEMAVSAASVPPPPRRTGWDMEVDRGLLLLRASEPVSMVVVFDCIQGLLEAANVRGAGHHSAGTAIRRSVLHPPNGRRAGGGAQGGPLAVAFPDVGRQVAQFGG